MRGLVDQADLTPSEKQRALANIEKIYAARAAGRLSASDAQQLARAEAPFQSAASRGAAVPTGELETSLRLLYYPAEDL